MENEFFLLRFRIGGYLGGPVTDHVVRDQFQHQGVLHEKQLIPGIS
jgi:hypothetical protein